MILLLLGLAAGWWIWSYGGAKRAGRGARPTQDEARRMLDLPAGASADQVRAAHRRLVARVHPDAGGSTELTARVNAARDVLLRGGA